MSVRAPSAVGGHMRDGGHPQARNARGEYTTHHGPNMGASHMSHGHPSRNPMNGQFVSAPAGAPPRYGFHLDDRRPASMGIWPFGRSSEPEAAAAPKSDPVREETILVAERVLGELGAKASVTFGDLEQARRMLNDENAEMETGTLRKAMTPEKEAIRAAANKKVVVILNSPIGTHDYDFLFHRNLIPHDVFNTWADMHLTCLRSDNRITNEGLLISDKVRTPEEIADASKGADPKDTAGLVSAQEPLKEAPASAPPPEEEGMPSDEI